MVYPKVIEKKVIYPGDALDVRENLVLMYWSNGYDNADIAKMLKISISSVKTASDRLKYKLEVTNRTNAVARGLREGIIE